MTAINFVELDIGQRELFDELICVIKARALDIRGLGETVRLAVMGASFAKGDRSQSS
jgi:hypothetical protein